MVAEDGTLLLYSVTKDGMASLWTMPKCTAANRSPGRSARSTSTDPMSAVFSPDGKLVAYTRTDRTCDTTICVEPFPVTVRSSDCLPPNRADSPKHPRWSAGRRAHLLRSASRRTSNRSAVHDGSRSCSSVDASPCRITRSGWRLPATRTPYDITASGKFIGPDPVGTRRVQGRPSEDRSWSSCNWFEVLKAEDRSE